MESPRPPSFPVGPEMSGEILRIISEHRAISHVEVARMLGADPDHPFFLTDLAVARAWLAGESVPSHRVDRLEREQWANVQVAVAMMAADVASAALPNMSVALPIMERLEAAHLSSEHLSLAIQLVGLLGTISDAGQIDGPIETILRECIEADPDVLSRGADVASGAVKKVLSGPSEKDGSQRTIELPVDHGTGIGGEGEGSSDVRTGPEGETTKPDQGDERGPAT